MTLNTATDLTAALQAWLEDDDAEFLGSIPDVIDLGEKRLLRDLDLSIFRRTDATETMTIGIAQNAKPTIAAPDLLIATKSIYLSGGTLPGPKFLVSRSHEYLHDYNSGGANGVPRFYGEVDENTWIFGPAPDDTYTINLIYLSRPDRLIAGGNETNWLSDNAYDILFKACLAEAEKFLKSDERAPMWEQDYILALVRGRRELYNLFGNQYDQLGTVPQLQSPRSNI